MLVQSHAGIIQLLPALPKDWATGEVKGLKARGGFVIDMKWQNNELISALIYSEQGRNCHIRYKDKLIEITIERGESKTLNSSYFKLE